MLKSHEKKACKMCNSKVLLHTSQESMTPTILARIAAENGYQETEVFLFDLRYSEPPEYFEELSRYVYELDECSGRKGIYKGIIGINCSQWLGSEQSEYFDAFLAYLCDHQEYVQYVFIVPETLQMTTMKNKLEEYFKVCLTEPERQTERKW